MTRSVSLQRWSPVGVSWKSMLSDIMNSFRAVDNSLSKRWRHGFRPWVYNILMIFF